MSHRNVTLVPTYEAGIAAEAYDHTVTITGNAAAIGLLTGDWSLYNAAYQRLQGEARTAIATRHLAEAAR